MACSIFWYRMSVLWVVLQRGLGTNWEYCDCLLLRVLAVSPQNASLSLCILNQLIHIYYKLWKLMSDVLQGWRQFSSFQFISIPTYSCRGGSSDISQHALGKSRDSLHTLPSWFGAKFTYLHRWTIQRTACLFTVKWNYRAWRKPQRWGENTSSLLIERTKVMSCTCRRSPFIKHNATFEFE